ncbi:MAG: hypothetical protein O8C64_12070 [Candidatus Methanoperedens sp.]|nr:hypothetical protein [Candidatus Methanoperedens sp.]MCZ7404881.1 hypothetical protein [Candidatus Methanoperedens sp.]
MTWADEWVKAWRESEETGKIFNESCAENKEIPSLDRHFVQLRQGSNTDSNKNLSILKPPNEILKNHDVELKAFLKSQGILFGDSLAGTKLYFGDEWEKLLEDYNKWKTAMEHCYLLLKNKKGFEPSRQAQDGFYRSSVDKKGIVAQCQTRFSSKSKKITRWRMEQFSDKMKKRGLRFGLQITLTTDPKRFSNLKEVGEKWKFFLEKFMDFMNARLRRAGKKETTCYLRACELTDSGLLHIHIGLYGAGITGKITRTYADGHKVKDYLFPQKDINDLWEKYGIGEISWVNRAPVDEVCDYITKHVAKNWGGESNELLEAFLHFTNMRQWTSSKGAVPKEPPCVERWEVMNVAFSQGEALLARAEMIKDGCVLIQDDLKMEFPLEATISS